MPRHPSPWDNSLLGVRNQPFCLHAATQAWRAPSRAGRPRDGSSICARVGRKEARWREALLDCPSTLCAVDSIDVGNCRCERFVVVDDDPRATLLQHLGTEPRRMATTGVPQARDSIITRPNG